MKTVECKEYSELKKVSHRTIRLFFGTLYIVIISSVRFIKKNLQYTVYHGP